MSVLRTENVTISYEDKKVIDDISIHLEEGELVSLLGVSGSGKTTLFNIISGLLVPDEGRVWLAENEADYGAAVERDITGKPGNTAYMLQKDMLLPHKKIVDNVALPLLLKGVSRKDARARAEEFFEEFGLEGTQYKYPSQLSGGMRQRAALLRTYLASNGVVLLDEPFSALDTLTKAAIHKWYLQVMEHINLSTLFITHDIDEAILLSDRIYIMSGVPGKIVDEIVISEKKPRREDFGLTPEFLEYKKSIISKL